MGGTAAIYVAGSAAGPPEGVDGVIALSAPIEFGDLDATEPSASLRVPVLLVAAEGDTSALDSLSLIGDAAQVPPSRRVVVAGAAHGTELLGTDVADDIWVQVSRFLDVIWPGAVTPLALGTPAGAAR
jgi:pimeloyl-ACP methyl ester carboxylesterase